MAGGTLVLLGVIAGAHGIRGEVKLKSFTAVPEDIACYGPLSDESGARDFSLTSVKPAKGALIARIDGVSDRNAAEALKGAKLYVPRARLPAPDEGDFYQQDLIGLAVADAAGRAYGQVLGVQNYGAGDLLEIGNEARSELLPFTTAFVPEVDLAGGRVIVAPPDGFWEDGDE